MRAWVLTMLFGGLALSAAGQDNPPGPPGRGPGRGFRSGPPPARPLEAIAQRITDMLLLSEEQQSELQKIVDRYREQADEAGPRPEQLESLWRQLREAQQAGDETRAAELRAQLEQERARGAELMQAFFDEVEGILDPPQSQMFARFRERFGRGIPPGGPRWRIRAMLRELPEQLALDETQRQKFDELVANLNAELEARRRQAMELRPLFEELRRAREAGDQQRVQQLRQQIDSMREGSPGLYQSFFSELEQILREDQKSKLEELRSSGGFAPPAERPLDVRTVVRAAQRLNLTEEQRSKVRELAQQAMRESRRLSRTDAQAQADLANRVRGDIEKLLTPEQKQQFERALRGEPPRKGLGSRPGRAGPRPAGPESPPPAPAENP